MPKPITRLVAAAAIALLFPFQTSCSNDELQDRLDSRTDAYENFQDRRRMRMDSRQERTDAWYDRAMDRSTPAPTGISTGL